MLKTQKQREKWVEVVEEYERSGLTQGQYAAQRGVALSTLQSWLRRRRSQNPVQPVRLLPAQAAHPAGGGKERGLMGQRDGLGLNTTRAGRTPGHSTLQVPGEVPLHVPRQAAPHLARLDHQDANGKNGLRGGPNARW